MSVLHRHGEYVTRIIYEKIVGEQVSKLEELKDPGVIYVTDLVACTHRFHLKKSYPWLSITFEPPAILGSIAHWGLGLILKERGVDVEVEVSKEVEVRNRKYLVKGRVDAVDKKDRLVIEIKTARVAIGLPKEHHVKQLNLYLNMLGYERGVLVYLTPSKLVEYVVEARGVDLQTEVVELLEDRYHPRYSWECKYCVFSRLCPYYLEQPERGEKR